MTDAMSPRWYVVQTQVNGEARAAQHLQRQGFDVYLPRYLKRRRHARKLDFVAKPLFPRYMFVAFDIATQRWRSIQSTFGVSRLVCNGDDPAVVPDGVVGHWRTQFDLIVDGTDPVELRAFLKSGGETLTETWMFQYHPF